MTAPYTSQFVRSHLRVIVVIGVEIYSILSWLVNFHNKTTPSEKMIRKETHFYRTYETCYIYLCFAETEPPKDCRKYDIYLHARILSAYISSSKASRSHKEPSRKVGFALCECVCMLGLYPKTEPHTEYTLSGSETVYTYT